MAGTRHRSFAALLLFLAGVSVASACDVRDAIPPSVQRARAGTPLTDEERTVILELHESCRRTASPRPQPPLPSLRWSEELAGMAQGWADRCRFEHSSDLRYGENLSFATNGSIVGLVLLWTTEASDYSYATKRCARGEICGHYTQVVARRSTSIGCGVAQCEFGRYLVCNYSPNGNIRGKRPY